MFRPIDLDNGDKKVIATVYFLWVNWWQKVTFVANRSVQMTTLPVRSVPNSVNKTLTDFSITNVAGTKMYFQSFSRPQFPGPS